MLFWRGGSWKPTFSSATIQQPDLYLNLEWEEAIEIIAGKEARPYIKYESESKESEVIHMAFTDGHPRDVAQNAIYYACLNHDNLQNGIKLT